MSIEKSVNEYGQEQIINNFDKIIKIGDKFLQVRLIKTKRWRERFTKNGRFTEDMPRAKFINSQEHFYYLVNKKDLTRMQKRI